MVGGEWGTKGLSSAVQVLCICGGVCVYARSGVVYFSVCARTLLQLGAQLWEFQASALVWQSCKAWSEFLSQVGDSSPRCVGPSSSVLPQCRVSDCCFKLGKRPWSASPVAVERGLWRCPGPQLAPVPKLCAKTGVWCVLLSGAGGPASPGVFSASDFHLSGSLECL